MGNDLTSESQYLLYLVYKDYLQKRKSGQSIRESRYFDPQTVGFKEFKAYDSDDFFDLIRELDRHNYLNVGYGNNIPIRCSLSDKAIRTGENHFKNQLANVIDEIIKLKKLISPLG